MIQTKSSLIIGTIIILLLIWIIAVPINVCSEMYSWTDDDGVVNFTDSPMNAPKDSRHVESADNEVQSAGSADIVGSWSNEKNEFKTLNCVIKPDHGGLCVTAVGIPLPFTWQLLDATTIEMAFSELDPPQVRSEKSRPKKSQIILADYSRETETIQMRGGGKDGTVLYRVEDADFKARKRKEFKRNKMYETDRFVFSELTVRDLNSGLTWTRDASLAQNGEVVAFGYAQRFVEDLNKQKYGGFSDWRLPTLKELQDFARFGKGFYHETSPKTNSKNWGVASVFNSMGFYGVKPFYYWTATIHPEYKQYPYCVSLTDGSDTYNIDYYTRHIWPVRGGR